MNSARLFFKRFFSVAFSSVFFISIAMDIRLTVLQAQSVSEGSIDNIENEIPRELLAKPEIAADVERLRSLRKNARLFGKKHPAFATTQKQIAELEAKLSAYRQSQNQNAQQDPIGLIPEKMDESDKSHGQSDLETSQEIATDYSKINFGASSRLVLAYPKLALPELMSVGVFPAMGLMWGIEFDSDQYKSRVWQWQDQPDVSIKSLYFEIDGLIESVAFPNDVQESPFLYLLISERDVKDIARITVLQISIEPLPPFSTRHDLRPQIILQAKSLHRDRMDMTHLDKQDLLLFFHSDIYDAKTEEPWNISKFSQPNIWLVSKRMRSVDGLDFSEGTESFFRDSISQIEIQRFVKQGSQKKGVFELLPSGNALTGSTSSRLMADSETGAVSIIKKSGESYQANQNPLVKTSRGIKGLYTDTVNEPVLLDGFGQLLAIEPITSKDTSTDRDPSAAVSSQMPKKISQTRWFDDVARGVLSNRFVVYTPKALQKELPKNVVPEFYLYIPKDKEIHLSETTRAFEFPAGTVLLQHFKYSPTGAPPRSLRTFALVRTSLEWIPLVYDWNYQQDDAVVSPSQDDALFTVSSQEEMEFFDTRKRLSKQNCLACHQGPKAFSGLGIKNATTMPVNSPGDQSVDLQEYLFELGIIQE